MRLVLLSLLLSLGFNGLGQTKSYITKTIGQWNLEKFPEHYSSSPLNKNYIKNSKSGKLEAYEELNKLGKSDGLQILMSADGKFPYSANYFHKGTIVYSAAYFPNTSKAQQIHNFNLSGDYDGYQLTRKAETNGNYTEEVEKYKDGVLIELNGLKIEPATIAYRDSLLNGKFKFYPKENYYTIDGEAENGKLKSIRQVIERTSHLKEITFRTDSFEVKRSAETISGFETSVYPLRSNPLVTNSISNCVKYGNLNGYPYLYLTSTFDIEELIRNLQCPFPVPLESKSNFVNGLLDGEFQFRNYKMQNNYYEGVYYDVFGIAENGKLLQIKISNYEFSVQNNELKSNKVYDYFIQDGEIVKKEYVPSVSDQPLATNRIKIEYNVLLTNSDSLGGHFSFYNQKEWNSIFKAPGIRKARLEGDTYGFFYFSTETFDMDNLMKVITEKRKKPIERKVDSRNSFIDGPFEFEYDGNDFKGLAHDGLLSELDVTFNYNQNIRTTAGSFNYDRLTLVFIDGEIELKYFKASTLQPVYTNKIKMIREFKISNNKDLTGYDGFVIYNNDSELSQILLELKFGEK